MRVSITAAGTMASYLSVVIWTAMLAIALRCEAIPPLYLAGFTVFAGGLWQAAKELRAGGLRGFKAPAGACLFEAFGVTGYRALVYPALFMTDAIEATILSQLWIVCAMIGGLLIARERLSARQWLGALCAAAGVALTVGGGLDAGHVLALCASLLWAWYAAQSAYVPAAGGKAAAIGNIAGGGVIILLAFLAGNELVFEGDSLLWFCCLLLAANAGMALWEYGASHGAPRAAKVSVLFMPFMAVMWLWILAGEEPDSMHLFATAAVTAAGLIISPHLFRAAKTVRE